VTRHRQYDGKICVSRVLHVTPGAKRKGLDVLGLFALSGNSKAENGCPDQLTLGQSWKIAPYAGKQFERAKIFIALFGCLYPTPLGFHRFELLGFQHDNAAGSDNNRINLDVRAEARCSLIRVAHLTATLFRLVSVSLPSREKPADL
jgi:hypothetical protein